MRAAFVNVCAVAAAAALSSLALGLFVPASTESAAANGDTRTIHFYHTHTGESIDATFRVDGHYDPDVLRQLNHFLRDWRNNDEHEMDPRLFDALWEAYRSAGATDRIQIYSAYRSPETNAMLRRRSRAVAEHSQHMLGKAMDTTMPGFPMERIREAAMKLQHGGVGWYPSANFVHIDVGGVRSWPRMSYEQLAQLFPDGKTVHIAADGRTLPGYDQARVELAERGNTEVPPPQQSMGFFAWLFGGGSGGSAAHEDEEDRRAPAVVASAAPQAMPQQQAPAPEPAPPARPVAANPAASEQVASGQVTSGQVTSAEVATAQPLDGRARIDGQQVASLDASAIQPDDGSRPTPLPPRRPADLADETDTPMPPVRPIALDRLETASIRFSDAKAAPVHTDTIAGLITSTTSGVPMLRRSGLPAIITRGARSHDLFPDEALAFAPAESPADRIPVPLPVARPANLLKPLALRSARRRPVAPLQTMPLDVADGGTKPGVGLAGPKLTGLRHAAKVLAQDASL